MTTEAIELYTLTELSVKFTAVDAKGLPISLVGSQVVFQSHGKDRSVGLDKAITETSDPEVVGQITDAVNGIFYVFFSQADTTTEFDGTYSLRWYIVDGETGNFLLSGDPCEKAEFKICYQG